MSATTPARVRPHEQVAVLTALAADACREHAAAETSLCSAVDHAIRCGEILSEVKASLPHGEWLPWLAENFTASARTAQGYMRLTAHAANAQGAAYSGIAGALRQLAAPRTALAEIEDMEAGLADALAALDPAASEAAFTDAHELTARIYADIARRLDATADAADVQRVIAACTRIMNAWREFTWQCEMGMADAADAPSVRSGNEVPL